MRFRARRERTPAGLPLGPDESVLAWCRADDDRLLVGSRDALHILGDGHLRLPWEQVEAADWDRDSSTLRVTEVGSWGQARPEHLLVIEEPGRMLELVRERVTASVVLQWHVPVQGRRGVRVIARRAPRGDRPLAWFYEYDEGVDPDDPEVREAATAALARAQDEVGQA